MSRPLIMQQYYTRGRQGIFRANEGYDTVAKSTGLDNQFIKKTLHPFCVYQAPRQLQERSEADLSRYPKALVCFRAETGEMVLGQSVFVGADFTGQRNTFFSHNYVIPAERSDVFVREPARIFGVESFQQQYDEALGKELPGLDELPYKPGTAGQQRRQLLQQLGIDQAIFKQLLHAIMLSLSGKKKVFISLPGDIAESTEQANELLEILYTCLPYEMRRHFGFLTYSDEPQSKKHIHLMFVEAGSIRPGNGQNDKDFLFDLANKRLLNTELTEGKHEYLDFVWEFLQDSRILASLHDFCEEVLQGADRQTALSLVTYYQLCALYQIEKGRMSVYESNRAGIWQVLNHYLRETQLLKKNRLHQLMRALFVLESQALSQQIWPEMEVVKQIADSYVVARNEVEKTEKVQYVIDVLSKGKNLQKTSYVAEVFQHVSRHRDLFHALMRQVLGYKVLVKPLFEEYLVERLSVVKTITQMLKEIEFWAKNAPLAIRHPFFAATTIPKLIGLVIEERNRLDAVMQIHHFLDTFAGSPSYAEELLDEVDKTLLKKVTLDTLSQKDFDLILSLLEEKPQTFFAGLDLEARNKLDMIMNIASLEELSEIPGPEEFFRKWDGRDIESQQKLLQNMLIIPLREKSFGKVALVYYVADESQQAAFRYAEMISCVENGGGDQAVYAFVQWAMMQHMFFTGKKLEPEFRQALKSFFAEERGRRLRQKEWRKRWYAIRNADFRNLLDEVRNETMNPLVKFFRKKGTVVTGVIVLVAAGAVSGYLYWQPGTLPATQPSDGDTHEGNEAPARVRVPQDVEFVPVYKLMVEPKIEPVLMQPALPEQASESPELPTEPTHQGG